MIAKTHIDSGVVHRLENDDGILLQNRCGLNSRLHLAANTHQATLVADDIEKRKGPEEDTELLGRVDLQAKGVLEIERTKSDAEAVRKQHSASCDHEQQHVVEGKGDSTRDDEPVATSIGTKLHPAKSSPDLRKQRALHRLVSSVDPLDNRANLIHWHCHRHHVVKALSIDTEGFEDASRARIHQILEIDRILPHFARWLMQECNHDVGCTLTVFSYRLVDVLRNVLVVDDPPIPLPPNRQIVLPGHCCDGQLCGPSRWGIGINKGNGACRQSYLYPSYTIDPCDSLRRPMLPCRSGDLHLLG